MTKTITIILPFLLFFNYSCTTNNHKSVNPNPSSIEKSKTINEILEYPFQSKKIIAEAFEINLDIDKSNDTQYSLTVDFKLDKGSYIISPFSKDDFYLPFSIAIDESKFIQPEQLLEAPITVEELDTIINKQVRFVRENTTFTQKIKVLNQDDFDVTGLIEFLIEPQCIPYDVEFVISNNSGKLNVEKTKTYISKEYKL